MIDTTWFVQCENCENCTEEKWGYCCDKHSIHIDNPKKDGCTWGNPKEADNPNCLVDVKERGGKDG